MRAIRIQANSALLEAADLYRRHDVDFIDTYHAVDARRRRANRIYSYVEDFDRLDIKREEP